MNFVEFCISKGYTPYRCVYDKTKHKHEYVKEESKYLDYFSSAAPGYLDIRLVKGDKEIVYGLHEANHFPTLIYPRQPIGLDATSIDRAFDTYTFGQILEKIEKYFEQLKEEVEMDSRKRAQKVRRRRVANLAVYSKKHSIYNCTIPQPEEKNLVDKKTSFGIIKAVKGVAEWDIPEGGFKQPKRLQKKYNKKYYCKNSRDVRKIVEHKSDYKEFPDHTFRPKGRAWFMEQMVQHKLAKWERKNPCPIKKDNSQQDLFEAEFLTPWKNEREKALERFRDFVVSIYDKLPLTGRFKINESGMASYQEKLVAEIKDIGGEGHKINDLDQDKSKLLKSAKKITNKTKGNNPNLVCTNLKDHKRQKGRIILPDMKQAA